MKKKYLTPANEAHSLGTTQTLLAASLSSGIAVHPEEEMDAADALVKENTFDFCWE